MTTTVTTFAVALSPEMAPSCKIIAYHVTPDGEVIADMLTLPIIGISREELILNVNRKQDRTGNLIELVPYLGLGSIIGLSAHDVDTIGNDNLSRRCVNRRLTQLVCADVQGFHEITPASALLELYRHVRGKQKKLIHKNSAGRNEKVLYATEPARNALSQLSHCNSSVFACCTSRPSILPRTITPERPNLLSRSRISSYLPI